MKSLTAINNPKFPGPCGHGPYRGLPCAHCKIAELHSENKKLKRAIAEAHDFIAAYADVTEDKETHEACAEWLEEN